MKTQLVDDRQLHVDEILGAFGLAVGGTFSGVAYGGSFIQSGTGAAIETRDPSTGGVLAHVRSASEADCSSAIAAAQEAFKGWRSVPPPKLSEARGEVQEVIDICDLAVGQSRQLYGREIASERRDHRLVEQWHPLGVVGIISAFNFPVAVPGWGWAIALVCGDTIAWKPSSLTPLISIAAQQIFHEVTAGTEAEGVFSLVIGSGG